jgi:hypothetical protein
MKCVNKMGSGGMLYSPSVIKIGINVQALLRFCLSNLKCCNIGIIDRRDLLCTPLKWAQVAWYNTTFQDDRYRHLNNIIVITSKILEAVMLVLLIKRIYEVRRWDGSMWHDTHTKFHEDWYRHSSNIKVLPQKFERLYCWYYRFEGFMNAPLR